MVDIKNLPYGKRPKSDNPEFWDVWTRKNDRSLLVGMMWLRNGLIYRIKKEGWK